jgi:hypothetical protein
MGRDRRTATIYASVSRHNSEQDDIDDALWDELIDAVRDLISDPRYDSISPDVG